MVKTTQFNLILAVVAISHAFPIPSADLGRPALQDKLSVPDIAEKVQHEMSHFSSSRRQAISFATLTAVGMISSKSEAAVQNSSPADFLGTYSDPINHPGGKRTIKLLGETFGDYTLAQVYGGGGVGEPKEYVLPAVIFGDRAIVIDFSPKGGPRDFTGVLEKDGSIKFLRDGNRWPRIES